MNHVHMTCEPEVHDMIMNDCKTLFLSENPKFTGIKMSTNFMLRKIAEFYLKAP